MAVLYSFLLLLLRKRTKKKNKRIKDFQSKYSFNAIIFFQFCSATPSIFFFQIFKNRRKKNKRMQMQFVLKQIHTALLPFVLLLQHPMCPMYYYNIPLPQIVCLLRTCSAHVFCLNKKKKKKMHYQRYDQATPSRAQFQGHLYCCHGIAQSSLLPRPHKSTVEVTIS